MNLTLTNDFHNTSITLRLNNAFLSTYQVKKARKALCGSAECLCSGVTGMRGKQPDETIILGQEEMRTPMGGYHLTPRFLIK